MARRKFDKQFKNSAVKLILEEGYYLKAKILRFSQLHTSLFKGFFFYP
ncbi:hypothetical protein [Lactococcus lactis]